MAQGAGIRLQELKAQNHSETRTWGPQEKNFESLMLNKTDR